MRHSGSGSWRVGPPTRLVGGALGVVAAIACVAPAASRAPTPASVRPGMDVLLTDSLHRIAGRRVGLVTNMAAVGAGGTPVIALVRDAPVRLVALFGPEHGLSATAAPGEKVASAVDPAANIPIYSLYGATRRPSPEMLAGIEVMVVDLPDVGARYYTYIGTTIEVMRAAAEAGIPVVIADRPNPIGGEMQGNILDPAHASFVGSLAVPMRHGLTLGEQALLAKADLGISVELTVIPAAGWQREAYFESTGLPFRAPSPNLKDVDALFHYPGTCLFEGTALSVGRGTDLPFHQVGAPWLDTAAVLARIRAAPLEGVRFEGTTFVPRNPGDGKYADTVLQGIRLVITDRDRYDSPATAVYLLATIRAVHPEEIRIGGSFDRLAGGPGLREALAAGVPPAQIVRSWQPGLREYRQRVEAVLLYR